MNVVQLAAPSRWHPTTICAAWGVAALTLGACGSPAPEEPESVQPQSVQPESVQPQSVQPPPVNADVDYQIAGDYDLVGDTEIVSRDWFEGVPAPGAYSICYVNAFQTQPDDPDVDRPDETSAWPQDLVLTALADDPNWTGEYLIDLSTSEQRADAAIWVGDMVTTCADKGFDAVEFDNLDSWSRFADIPSVQALVPFDRDDAVDYAALITEGAHDHGLAVGQKNTVELIDDGSAAEIGFDFAITEECGQFEECGAYASAYDNLMIDIEYTDEGFNRACDDFGDELSIVRRDRLVATPADADYVLEQC